jgi:hypothetical protein
VLTPERASLLRARIEEAFREIGTLLLAFTPLDAVLWADHPDHRSRLLTFLALGTCFLGGALISELWRTDG